MSITRGARGPDVNIPKGTARAKADMRKSRKLRNSRFAQPRHRPPFLSRKSHRAPSNAQNFLAARPPGPRSGTPFRTDPPVGLEGSSPTRAYFRALEAGFTKKNYFLNRGARALQSGGWASTNREINYAPPRARRNQRGLLFFRPPPFAKATYQGGF